MTRYYVLLIVLTSTLQMYHTQATRSASAQPVCRAYNLITDHGSEATLCKIRHGDQQQHENHTREIHSHSYYYYYSTS